MSSGVCAVCSSKAICFQATKVGNCRGCNLMKYPHVQIKALVNYFGNVAICADWKDTANYKQPYNINQGIVRLEQNSTRLTLEECFNVFTSEEKIPKYKCGHCNSEGTANLQLLITKLPDILIIHLKRFLYSDNFTEKLDTLINFPLQKLNMFKWFASAPADSEASKLPSTEYNLYAVTNHQSYTAAGGHYTTFIKSAESEGAWVECDDSDLKGVSEAGIVTKDAYLLFYRRKMMSASNIVNLTYKTFT
eukprot:TRINITY_DN11030_c0_g3_i1.p1 TRINITY_DN11030_c0_g3~~TRINITY_DN11030_c0_g3_i1.p1  ORF type:complete len:249 (+),score=41.52 TRINITY_DN11030_c0_g3_i1:671-1417(+)